MFSPGFIHYNWLAGEYIWRIHNRRSKGCCLLYSSGIGYRGADSGSAKPSAALHPMEAGKLAGDLAQIVGLARSDAWDRRALPDKLLPADRADTTPRRRGSCRSHSNLWSRVLHICDPV